MKQTTKQSMRSMKSMKMMIRNQLRLAWYLAKWLAGGQQNHLARCCHFQVSVNNHHSLPDHQNKHKHVRDYNEHHYHHHLAGVKRE